MANYNSFSLNGHGNYNGGYDPGAVGQGYKEADITRNINAVVKKYLAAASLSVLFGENNYHQDLLKGHTFTNKCGASIHVNAGGGTGVEIYVPSKEGYLSADFELATEISTLLGIPNRGIKSRDYNSEKTFVRTNGIKLAYIDYYKEIRQAWEKGISLSIIEVGFIDTSDLQKILAKIDDIGFLIAKYIAKNCGIELKKPEPPKPTTPPTSSTGDTYFRVICGSFKDRNYALAQQEKLKKAGFDSFLEAYKKD